MAFANVVLNTKTYNPSDVTSGMARWMERSGSSPQAFSPLVLQVRPPAAGVKNYRVYSRMVVPVVKADDSACGCEGDFLRQIGFEVTATISHGSLLTERTDAYLRFKDWVAATNFVDAFQNLVPTYG